MMVLLLSSNRMEEADQALIQMYRKSGDKELIGELFNRYSGFVLAICMKYVQDQNLAEELTVEIFESLFLKLVKHNVDNFKAWLYAVSRSHCLLHHRSKQYRNKNNQRYIDESLDIMESRVEMYHVANENKPEFAKDIDKALSELSQEQRQCVELFYFQKKSYLEISRELAYDIKRVKSYIQNGKRNLKMILEGKK